MHKNLNAGAVAAAVLAFTSLVAGAADAPAAKDKPLGDRAGREAHEKALLDKREAEAKASAKADKAKQLTGAEQKALATKAREEYEQSVREKSGKREMKADAKARGDKIERTPMVDPATRAEEELARKNPAPADPPKKPK